MRPRVQAGLDLTLYFLFFLPGVIALLYAGYGFAKLSWIINEHSNVTADGPPVYHFKTVIPLAGALVLIQGFAEIVRCVVCLKTGAWPARLKDVEETDVIATQLSQSDTVDEEAKRSAIEKAHNIHETAHQRGMGDSGAKK
jgi:TRAP-type mannitol/chloroaromatic compound transport system permease small subunit